MIAIIGAGGHARCVYECFHLQGLKVAGFFDDNLEKLGSEVINGVKVIGGSRDVENHSEIDTIFVAIGDNRKRLEKFGYFKTKGYKILNAVHEIAYISTFVKMGEGNFIMGRSVINPGSVIGNYCIINTSATVGHDCKLEDGVQIGPGVNLAGSSILKKGAFIGIGAKVAPGVTVGQWAVVGAGSVVLDNLPDKTFCIGTPANVVKYFNNSGTI